jgi:hypothetical protein
MVYASEGSVCGTCHWFALTGSPGLKRPCREPQNLREAAMEAVQRYPWDCCPRWAEDLDGHSRALADVNRAELRD